MTLSVIAQRALGSRRHAHADDDYTSRPIPSARSMLCSAAACCCTDRSVRALWRIQSVTPRVANHRHSHPLRADVRPIALFIGQQGAMPGGFLIAPASSDGAERGFAGVGMVCRLPTRLPHWRRPARRRRHPRLEYRSAAGVASPCLTHDRGGDHLAAPVTASASGHGFNGSPSGPNRALTGPSGLVPRSGLPCPAERTRQRARKASLGEVGRCSSRAWGFPLCDRHASSADRIPAPDVTAAGTRLGPTRSPRPSVRAAWARSIAERTRLNRGRGDQGDRHQWSERRVLLSGWQVIGSSAQGKLKKMAVDSAALQTVAERPACAGASTRDRVEASPSGSCP